MPTKVSSDTAPSPSVTLRMLNGGISASATRIAGHVSPHAKLSATSISFAVVSVLYCGARTRNPGLRTPF